MMQTSVVLGLYLDRLESGQKDHPLLLLPAMNDLRAARGESLLSEGSLFEPDLSLDLPPVIATVKKPLSSWKQKKLLAELGEEFGDWVGHWEDDETNTLALTKMEEIARKLRSQLKKPALRRTWLIAEAVIRGVHNSLIENTITLRHLLKRLHQLMLDTAARPGDRNVALENDSAAKALLYQLATAASGEPLIDELKACYQLADQVPEALAMDHSRGFLGGQSRELFDSLGAALGAEIETLKEQLSEIAEEEEFPDGDFKPIDESLVQITATLEMLNLQAAAASLHKHVALWKDAIAEDSPPEEEQVDELAEDLIRVESRLEEYVATMGGGAEQQPAEQSEEDAGPFLQATYRHVMAESVGSIQTIKDGLRDWMNHTVGAGEILENTRLFSDIYGALLLTEQESVAAAARSLQSFTETLLSSGKEPGTAVQEVFSDAITTLELYLISQRDQVVDNIQALENTLLQRLESLADTDSLVASAPGPEPVETAKAEQDESFLDIFLEEFSGVYAELEEKTPAWLAEPEINDLLFDIRRGYHTLKGSGRMVGADAIGDFSWQIENLLNQVLEGKQPLGSDCTHIIRVAHAALPLLRQNLEGDTEAISRSAVDALSTEAAELAEGTACDFPMLAAALPSGLAKLLDGVESSVSAQDADPVLEELFRAEVEKHLATLQDFRAQLTNTPDAIAGKAHILAAHTISGSFAQSPVADEAGVFAALEQLFTVQAECSLELPEAFLTDFAAVLAIVDSRLQLLDAADADIELNTDGVADRLYSYLAELKQRAATGAGKETEADEDLVTFFLEEGREILERCDHLLNHWRDSPADKALVTNLQREIHTFKGSARMVGFETMGELSHALENTLEKIAEGTVAAGSELVELLEKGSDHLLAMLEAEKSGGKPPSAATLGKYLTALLRAEQQPAAAATTAAPKEAEPASQAAPARPPKKPEPKPEVQQGPVRTVSTASAPELRKPAPGYKPIEAPESLESEQAIRAMPAVKESKKAAKDTIRVSSELLDNFVNFAGEISVFRSRTEQQMSTARANLGEIHETITRLREQLRKMDVETENQILSRHRRESDQDSEDFDPLELDRYSTIQQLSRGLVIPPASQNPCCSSSRGSTMNCRKD
jgi:chemosensory pili system protein ChpA (sensor histidine kinase/response regulator)